MQNSKDAANFNHYLRVRYFVAEIHFVKDEVPNHTIQTQKKESIFE